MLTMLIVYGLISYTLVYLFFRCFEVTGDVSDSIFATTQFLLAPITLPAVISFGFGILVSQIGCLATDSKFIARYFTGICIWLFPPAPPPIVPHIPIYSNEEPYDCGDYEYMS